MSYKKTMAQVEDLMTKEYVMAAIDHGEYFSSPHEGYAIIKEEVEEALTEMDSVSWHLEYMWRNVRSEDPNNYLDAAHILERKALCLACEAIQIAAMAMKFRSSFEDEEDGGNEEFTD